MNARSRHLVDPELLDLLEVFQTVELTAENLSDFRAMIANLSAKIPQGLPIEPDPAAATKVATRVVKGPIGAPNVPLRVYQPPGVSGIGGCIFHIHGGGYVSGETAQIDAHYRKLSGELGCAVVAVDYRLAPETSFPGNIEDCYAALAWLFGHAAELHVDPLRIGVMGESAGGGLAAALALLARDRGELTLAFQHLIYPMLDDRTGFATESHPFTGEFVWAAQNNRFGWSALLGGAPGSNSVSPYAAAARADDLAGLPPTFIATAALDLFLEEDIQYARRLTRAGVPTELHVYPRAFHGFDLHPTAQIARAARRDSLAALARFLGVL